MIKFVFGLIFGVIVGAAAALYLSPKAVVSRPIVAAPAARPGTIHVSVDQAYLNKLMTEALAGQAQFKGMQPTLALQGPNTVIVTVDLQADVAGVTLKARPEVMMQLSLNAGRIRTHVANVNFGIVNVPLEPFQAQINQIESMMEDQANRAVTNGLAGTGLKIVNVTTSSNSLNVDLGE